MSPVSDLVESIVDMPGYFADVALQGQIEALLLLFGVVFIVVPSLVLAYLVLGAGVSLVSPGSGGATHPEE